METTETIGKLKATRRRDGGKEVCKKLRRQGLVPAVCYGKGTEAIPLTLDPGELVRSLDPERRRNTLLQLTIEDGASAQQVNVMVKDFQRDTLTDQMLHVDFLQVSMDRKIEVEVPFRVEGRAEGVKIGGTLHQVFRTIPVSCTPDRIPVALTVDVTPLQIGDSVRLGDLKLPEGVTISLRPTMTCVQVQAARKVEEVVEVAAEGAAEGEAKAAEGDAKGGEEKGADKGGKKE